MRRSLRISPTVLRSSLVALITLALPLQAWANVDVVWRPVAQTVCINGTVEIGLYVVSDDASTQTVGAVEVILAWDPSRLELLGNIDNGPYAWLTSGFPNDSGLDGLNAPFTGAPPFVPDNDGDAFYVAVAPFTPAPPAPATPQGLLVTTFRFLALDVGSADLEMLASFGQFAQTRVIDGAVAGLNVTGQLGGPSTTTVECTQPAVWAIGSRYLSITPAPCATTVALRVAGDAGDANVSCVDGYLQADGTLAGTPMFQTAGHWGTTKLTGLEVVPGTTYHVVTECETPGELASSVDVSATTWTWGDVNNDSDADLDDILLVLDGFQGFFVAAAFEALNLGPCDPNDEIDLDDILSVLDAFQSFTYLEACSVPCP